MGHKQEILMKPGTGVPTDTPYRLTRGFLDRHWLGLADLLRRFPSIHSANFNAAIEMGLRPGSSSDGLAIALEEACETLLSLRDEDFQPLPIDAERHTNFDAGLRWYAARLRDLSQAARAM